MKAFLKLILLIMVTIIALKLLPLTFVVGCALAAALFGLIALGVSVLAALLGAVIVLVAVSSPIWIPLLVIVGLIALLKRRHRSSPTVAT